MLSVLTKASPPPPQLTPQISWLIHSSAKHHCTTATMGNQLFRLSASALQLRYPLNCNRLIGGIYRGTACQLSLNEIRLNSMKMSCPCSLRLLEMSSRIDRGPRLPGGNEDVHFTVCACMCLNRHG